MARIETKVTAGSLAAGAAGAAVWALQTWVFHGSAVPDGLVSLVYLAVPAILSGLAGYLAPHTPRPVAPAQQIAQGMEYIRSKYADGLPPPPVPAEPQPPGATEPPSPEAAV